MGIGHKEKGKRNTKQLNNTTYSRRKMIKQNEDISRWIIQININI